MTLAVLRPGTLTTLQDRGRHGWRALGVGAAGAMDDVSLRLANALVGNDDDAVALELTWSGPRLRFEQDALVAICGAACEARVDGTAVAGWRPLRIDAGSELDCGALRHGARACLAIAGGFAVERVLGSGATDLNAGIGALDGRALRAGDRLAWNPPRIPLRARRWSLDPHPWFDGHADAPIRLIAGSHSGLLDAASSEALHAARFSVHADSNRVGIRLEGPTLTLASAFEAVSEPVARGTVQLPPAGRPILLMAEHPTTGGYPRIGQVAAIDLPRVAQRRPGDPVRFQAIGLDEAQSRYLARERALERLILSMTQRLADD